MKKIYALAFICIIILISCCKLTDPNANKKSWTFMWYLDGDEISMQQDFIAAFYDIIASGVGSTDDVNIIIQFDRYPHMDDFGGWEITERFYYLPSMEPTPENAIQDWGDGQGGREVNMADPATLQDFITWAVANYPAEHYALMLADHGYGWQGLMIDMTSDGDFMVVKEVVRALKNSQIQLDLLALNACTMQMIEVMYEFLEVPIDIVVGSENLGTTWPFTQILQAITDNPTITAANLGKEICDFYKDIHPADTVLTLSTIQLNKILAVEDALTDFCTTILDSVAFEVIQPKAQTVMDAIDSAVLHKVSGSVWGDAGGLSIYWPPMDQGYMPHTFFYSYIDEIISFAKDNPWRQFLYVFYNLWIYPDIMPSEFYQIYNQLSFFDDDKIDLYDFCKRIVEYQKP